MPLNIYLLRINVCRAPCHYVIDGSTDFQLMFSFVASNERKARGNKQKTDRSSSNNGRGRQRKHKSLSPEKRLASTLAQSMSSISKSFEKLDLIGHHRKRSRSNHEGPKKQRKRSEAAASNKEVTIGTYYNVPFFFCLSVLYDRKAIYSFVVNHIFLLFSSQTRTFQVQYGGCQAIWECRT